MNTSTVVQFYNKYMAKYNGWQQRFSVCSDCGWAEPVCLPVDDEYAGNLPTDLLKEHDANSQKETTNNNQ